MYISKNNIYIAAVVAFIIIAGTFYVLLFDNESYGINSTVATLTLNTAPYIPEEQALTSQEVAVYYEPPPLQPQAYSYSGSTIVVFISGEVNDSGVFELPHGARVVDALEMANGATPYADLNRINLARLINDEEHIIVPAFGQYYIVDYNNIITNESRDNQQVSTVESGLVNINTADALTLQTLPGVGPVISQNIINHREQHGQFTSIQQIQNVTRIGPSIFNNISTMITVD